jgi:hypothetical protein
MRRPEFLLVLLLGVALLAATLLGRRAAPDAALKDTRLSTLLAGPRGAKGLAQALPLLGVPVERRQRPLFDVARDSAAVPRGTTLALLDVTDQPTDAELSAVTDFVADGGRVLVVGSTGLEYCLGYDVAPVDSTDRFHAVPARVPAGRSLPDIRHILVEAPDTSADSATTNAGEAGQACELLEADMVDTLLTTKGGRAVAIDLYFDGGGRATLIAEPALLTNRALKETDAGLVVLPWLLSGSPRAILVDEFHQGFGRDGSLVAAVWQWSLGAPLGWLMLQWAVVALLALAAAAVRFGPALNVVERRRRSPAEHVAALAAGLERAEGRDTAIRLLAQGLRRRLSRGVSGGAVHGRPFHTGGDLKTWLRSLELASRSADAQVAVRRFANLTLQRGGDAQVLAAAIAVEDVWQALGPKDRHTKS